MNQNEYWKILKPLIPRILGQLDRDPDSPTSGSFDRNFWNYKIRDFSSAIIQQGVLILDVIYNYESEDNPFYQAKHIKELVENSVEYWTTIQLKNGSFNEYYPFEAGFPPTGFSLYAVSLLMDKQEYTFTPKLTKAIEKAADWILKHPEEEALNQEAAALSGICIAQSKSNLNIDEDSLNFRLDKLINAQSEEGWFNEYNGPDIGYLSVTVDCLSDVYLITNDSRIEQVIIKAIKFISKFVTNDGYSPVMINSRNTDYITPYGTAVFANKLDEAKELLSKLFYQISSWDNQLYKTDDRYLCHYLGQSFFRYLNVLPEIKGKSLETNKQTEYFKDCGILKYVYNENTLFVSLRKGGVINLLDKAGVYATDFGYRIRDNKNRVCVSHWQDPEYTVSYKTDSDVTHIEVKGFLSVQKFLRPSPVKHIALRFLSKFFGNILIPFLKKQLIFQNKKSPYFFTRLIEINDDRIKITDDINGLSAEKVEKARHYSMRHVSSAGRFCREELIDEKKVFTAVDFPVSQQIIMKS